jgi:hypothetical protein
VRTDERLGTYRAGWHSWAPVDAAVAYRAHWRTDQAGGRPCQVDAERAREHLASLVDAGKPVTLVASQGTAAEDTVLSLGHHRLRIPRATATDVLSVPLPHQQLTRTPDAA